MQIPYDPDFDHRSQRGPAEGGGKPKRRPWGDVFAALGVARAFWIGVLLSLLIAGTIGFITMLLLR